MDTVELTRALTSNEITQPYFRGVFARDQTKEAKSFINPNRANIFIFNTDPKSEPGEHWVCVYIQGGKGELFDSFGMEPSNDLFNFIHSNTESWIRNTMRFQSLLSSVCGQYCIFFACKRSMNFSFDQILKMINNKNSDTIVHSYVKNNFSNLHDIEEFDVNFIIRQICKSFIEQKINQNGV